MSSVRLNERVWPLKLRDSDFCENMKPTSSKSVCSSESDIQTMSEREKDDKPKQNNPKKKYKRTRGSDDEEATPQWISFKEEIMEALNKITKDVEVVKVQSSNIQETNAEMSKSMSFLAGKYEELQQIVKDMKKERNDNLSYIKTLEIKVEDMQRNLKASTIEIRNVPIKATENQQELTNLVQKTCSVLDVNI